jgi:hypothetical protein
MNAIEFINNHNEVIFWNVYRFNEDNAEWDLIDPAEITDEDEVDEAFFNDCFEKADECDLYLVG